MLKWSKVQNIEIKMSDAPQPRLCHVVKVQGFSGYGFNLHTEKNKKYQLIGKVDPGSPAQIGGLREGDRIIAINGVHVGQENHNQVVQRIKAGGEETRILVVDKECEAWHNEKGVVITGSLPYILHLSSVRGGEERASDSEDEREVVQQVIEEEEELSSSSEEETSTAPLAPSPESEEEDEGNVSGSEQGRPGLPRQEGRPGLPRQASVSSSSSSSVTSSEGERVQSRPSVSRSHTTSSRLSYDRKELVAGLELNMTAKEMRAKVSGHKKTDPRADKIDIWKKSEIIKNL